MANSSIEIAPDINEYLSNVLTIQYNIKPNFNNCSDIKGLRFVAKAICPWYCRFLHTKKHPRGGAFMRSRNHFP